MRTMLVVLMVSALAYGQQTIRDLSQRPTHFDNPEIVYGPPLVDLLSTFNESFEDTTFPPAGWLKLNPDGGTGWIRLTVGTAPYPGWNGGIVDAPPGGGNAVAFATYTTGGASHNDQWLVSPQVTNVQAGGQLSFWMRFPFSSYADSVDLLISTTGTAPADFNTIVDQYYLPVGSADTIWTQYYYDLTNYVSAGSDIYIAWREHVADNSTQGAIVLLDLMRVTDGVDLPELIYYQFDEGSGTTTVNAAVPGVGNNPASLTGTTVFTTPGQFGSAILGDGTIDGGVVSGWNVDLGGGPWTISMWLEIPSNPTGLPYYLFGDGGAGSFRCYHNGSAGQDNLMLAGSGAGIVDYLVTGIGPAPTVVAFVYDGIGTLTAYKNGTFFGAYPMVINFPPGTGFRVGGYGTSRTMLNAKMDEFRLYNRALDAAEIAATWQVPVPVELTSLTSSVSGNSVTLDWETATEINNSGFAIERKTGEQNWSKVGFVNGRGTTTEPQAYSFTDVGLSSGNYNYRLKQIDFDGSYKYYTLEQLVEVGIPQTYDLSQNYPNPFNPTTKITYSVPADGFVNIAVFNVLGEKVTNIVNSLQKAGSYEVTFDATNFASGMYLYRMESGDFVSVKKMMILK